MDKEKALLIYSGWLGDLVWIIPTINALKTRFSQLSIVASEVQGPLAITMKGQGLHNVFIDSSKNRLSVARDIRKTAIAEGIGTYIDIKGRGKAGVFIPWRFDTNVFIPSRIDAREFMLARLLHPLAVSMPPRNHATHMVNAYLDIARFFGVANQRVDFRIPFSNEVTEKTNTLIVDEGIRTGKTVAISPGSAQFSKIWPAANYRRLAEMLKSDLGCKVVIMGAREFRPNGNYDLMVSRQYFNDGAFLNLTERTDMLTDACLFTSGVFDVAVGNDSFAGHIAGSASEVAPHAEGAFRAPDGKHYKANRTVSLFGPTNPFFCRPYDPTGQFNLAVRPKEYPATCHYNRTDHICHHYRDKSCIDADHCMKLIEVDEVFAAVEQQLARAS